MASGSGQSLNMDVATLSSIVASAVHQTLQQQQQSPSPAPVVTSCAIGPSTGTGHVITAQATLSDRLTTGR